MKKHSVQDGPLARATQNAQLWPTTPATPAASTEAGRLASKKGTWVLPWVLPWILSWAMLGALFCSGRSICGLDFVFVPGANEPPSCSQRCLPASALVIQAALAFSFCFFFLVAFCKHSLAALSRVLPPVKRGADGWVHGGSGACDQFPQSPWVQRYLEMGIYLQRQRPIHRPTNRPDGSLY